MAQYRYDAERKCLVNCGKENQGFKLGRAYESGGAGCISSVDDYIRFAEALRKENVLLNTKTNALNCIPLTTSTSAASTSWQKLYCHCVPGSNDKGSFAR